MFAGGVICGVGIGNGALVHVEPPICPGQTHHLKAAFPVYSADIGG